MSLLEFSPVYKPQYLELVEIFKSHERSHWVVDEVKMQVDVEQWKNGKITEDEKQLIKSILRLFTESDKAVASGYYDKLIPAIKNNDARMMLGSFAAREATHQVAYALLNDTLGFGEEFYYEFLEWAEMKDKYEFMVESHDTSTPQSLATYLAKQVFMEGVSLFSSFAMLINFDRRGILPGMADVVRWSSLEEGSHIDGLSSIFKILVNEYPEIVNDSFKKDIYDYAREVVDLEDAFINLAFEDKTIEGFSIQEAKEYVRYVADCRLTQLGLKRNWGYEKIPPSIIWVEQLLGNVFSSFFEREVSQYSKANLQGEYTEGY